MMQNTIQKIQSLLLQTEAYFKNIPEEKISAIPSADKWSEKEILGHLIDSAIHNLVRFTEIEYIPQPYQHRKYDQNALVKINNYQMADLNDLLQLWILLNRQVIRIIELQTWETLKLQVQLTDSVVDLKFLINDYREHLEHHLSPLIGTS